MPRSSCHFVNKQTMLPYSISPTEWIMSSIANQRRLSCDRMLFILKLDGNIMVHVFHFLNTIHDSLVLMMFPKLSKLQVKLPPAKVEFKFR